MPRTKELEHTMRSTTIAVTAIAATAALAQAAETIEYRVYVSPFGLDTIYSAFLLDQADQFDGGTVIDAHFQISITVDDIDLDPPLSNDAAHFYMNAGAPIDVSPAPGVQGADFSFVGSDAGWSGTGDFSYSTQLDEFIGGTFRADAIYSSVTYYGSGPTDIVAGTIDEANSYISFTVQQIPTPASASVLGLGGLLAARRRR